MGQRGERPLNNEEREYLHTLYERHHQALSGYAYSLGFQKEVVEEYVQDTFLAALRRIDVLRSCDNPRAYLMTVLKNVIGYQLRCMKYAAGLQRKLREKETADQSKSREILSPEVLYAGMVSDEELRLLLRFYHEGWTQKELAEEMGIDLNACKKRIQRAKEHLRNALEHDGKK